LFIIPLTHESGSVEKLPWMSFGIVALCLLSFFTSGRGESRPETDQSFESAFDYYIDHPWLAPDVKLIPRESQALIAEILAERGVKGSPVEDPLAQRELDRRTASWVDATVVDPSWTQALIPSAVRGTSLFTHQFLHAGWAHLLGNMFFLFLTAPFVEDRWGRVIFVAFYLTAGVVSGFGFALHFQDLYRPLVGASGAIAAVMGAFLVLFGATRMRFFYWFGAFVGTFSAPAAVMLGLWGLGELISARVNDAANPGGMLGGTAYWAHVWGFAFGLVVALVLRTPRLARAIDKWRYTGERLEAAPDGRLAYSGDDAILREARRLLSSGRKLEAWEELVLAIQDARSGEPVARALQILASDLSSLDDAVPHLLDRVRRDLTPAAGMAVDEQRRRQRSAAVRWRELRALVPDLADRAGQRGMLDTANRLRLSEELCALGASEQVREVLAPVIEGMTPTTPMGTVLKTVRLAAVVDPALYRDAAIRALAHPGLPPESRDEIEPTVLTL
jgi:membrane associated rhomboid family serine protease